MAWRLALRAAFFVACLLIPAGTWRWPAAWLVSLLQEALWCAIALHILRHDPGFIYERMSGHRSPGTARFDRLLMPLVVCLTLAMYLVAGLQRRLEGPSRAPLTVAATGAAVVAAILLEVACVVLVAWSVLSNRWFSSVVRLQDNRGHAVCCSGPYAVIRHPAYTAWILQPLAECVLLESSWLLRAGTARGAALVVRTALEDAWLRRNLPGYSAYAAKVRCRLVPWVW